LQTPKSDENWQTSCPHVCHTIATSSSTIHDVGLHTGQI